MGLQSAIQRIKLEAPTLPPMAFTQFCLRYRGECRTRPMFRGGPVRLTEERWADLKEINQVVNRGIAPERNELGVAGEQWLINPARGDCNDYAVSKRHELLERGWPARALLLSEVMVNSGEHHLILVVRTNSGDLVLDNMTPQIKPWSRVFLIAGCGCRCPTPSSGRRSRAPGSEVALTGRWSARCFAPSPARSILQE
ncbi:putative transglutaminase-like cysteine proteinase [Bradyrhizobium sp. F1.13.4]